MVYNDAIKPWFPPSIIWQQCLGQVIQLLLYCNVASNCVGVFDICYNLTLRFVSDQKLFFPDTSREAAFWALQLQAAPNTKTTQCQRKHTKRGETD